MSILDSILLSLFTSSNYNCEDEKALSQSLKQYIYSKTKYELIYPKGPKRIICTMMKYGVTLGPPHMNLSLVAVKINNF